jgi:hypothetical protein
MVSPPMQCLVDDFLVSDAGQKGQKCHKRGPPSKAGRHGDVNIWQRLGEEVNNAPGYRRNSRDHYDDWFRTQQPQGLDYDQSDKCPDVGRVLGVKPVEVFHTQATEYGELALQVLAGSALSDGEKTQKRERHDDGRYVKDP